MNKTKSHEMTTTEVMWFLGYKNIRSAADWCRKQKVHAISRRPGSHGENVYKRSDVERAKDAMVGRGKGGGRRKGYNKKSVDKGDNDG